MKTAFKTFSLLASAALFSLTSLTAVTTDPVGYKTVKITGDGGLSVIGLELLRAASYTGQFDSVVGHTITVSDVDFDALLDSEQSYFLEIIESANSEVVGLNSIITDWNAGSLSTGDDFSSVLTSSSDVFRLRSLPTLGEVFGVGGDVLDGGFPLTADLVLMPSSEGVGLDSYYYSTGGFAGVGWRKVGESGDKENTPIYFSDGLYVFKRSPGNAELVVTGDVKVTSTKLAIEQGFTPYSSVFPSGTTLGNSGLYDPEDLSSSIAAGFPTTADLVLTDSDDNGVLEQYYYSSGGFAGTGWRQVGENGDKSTTKLGSGFMIFKREGSVSVARSPSY